jgi:ribonuclease HI
MLETDYVLSYLSRTAHLGLTYSREHMRVKAFADASWETAHSTSGWVVLWQSAALSWGSRKQKSIALSSCEAEIIALSEGAKDVVYYRKLVDGLDAREPSPTLLYTDSQSARDVSYNPEHHDRMKHVQRRHFFVRDMVESFELEVPFVPTKENIADFFTKPMKSASQFNEFRRIVMNIRS